MDILNASLIKLAPAIGLFCFISTVTPGPNNILLAHSGARFGIKRTLPHVLGIRTGMTLLHIAILLGLGSIFRQWPQLHTVFAVGAASYIVYMSLKIAFASPHKNANTRPPMTIVEAACFQLINPKSWASLITASSIFTLSGHYFWPSAALGIAMFNIATLPGTFMWITIGKLVSNKLQDPKMNRIFNVVMGILLLTTLPMILMGADAGMH